MPDQRAIVAVQPGAGGAGRRELERHLGTGRQPGRRSDDNGDDAQVCEGRRHDDL